MLQQIKSIADWQSKSHAELALILSSVTVRPISIAELENYLDFEQLANRNPISGAWQGTLIVAMGNEALPQELREGLAKLFGHMNKPRSVQVDTTQLPWSIDAYQLTGGLMMAGVITADQRSGFYGLGGGLRNGSVTEQQVADVLQAIEKQAVVDATKAALEAWHGPINAKYNTLVGALSQVSLDSSIEDIQSYCDGLLAQIEESDE